LKQIKECGVYFFTDAIYVVAAARTIPGFCIDSEPIFRLERQSTPIELGEAIIAALNAFRLDVAPPDPRQTNTGPLLQKTRMRSWKELERRALLVAASMDGDAVRVTPTARDYKRGGYDYRPNLARECALDAVDVGTTTLRAVEDCS
jgi:hypothetical protein